MSEIVLKGVSAAPGVSTGHAFILDKQDFIIPPRVILSDEVPIEIARFEEALQKTRQEILEIQERVSSQMEGRHAKIFDAHLLVLEDKTLIDEVIERIEKDCFSAEYVLSEVLKKYIKIFSEIKDEYLRERGSDIDDVGRRILKNLIDEHKLHDFENASGDMIIVCHELSPSDSISLYNKNIHAFVTDLGGKTSHTAIMAKSLGIPAVVGLKDATLRIHNQDQIIVDGRKGLVIINPAQETLETYRHAQDRINESKGQFDDVKELATETIDGTKIKLLANFEIAEEMKGIQEANAEGIGLYRTEYFYMNRADLPTEDEQYEAYRKVAETMAPKKVVIRSLDLGGDKFLSSLQIPKDMYAFLGWRAIRFCLERPDIFKTQLRAVLRASYYGNIQLMYPMITGLGELRQANAFLEEAKDELRAKKIPFDENILVGVMIEVPSAAMISDLLAKESDFFSIGTNDLIQYCLAVDRVNDQMETLYEPSHPAILRMIKRTIDAAKDAGINVSLCGEMSSEPVFALMLLGMGINDLSMSPVNLLMIKKLIRSVEFSKVQDIATKALELETAQDIEAYLSEEFRKLLPELMAFDND